jgi:hypothetical protein
MKNRVEKRLSELRAEFDCGQRVAAELELKQANVRNTLLRITGAIQALEELLKEADQPDRGTHGGVNGTAAICGQP